MDTLIILVILVGVLFCWRRPRKPIGLMLFFVALVAVVLLFNYHVTSVLQLNF